MAQVDLDIKVALGDTLSALKDLTKALDKSLGSVEKEAKEAGKAVDKNLGSSFKSLRKSALKSVDSINKGFSGLADSIFSIKGAIAGVAGFLAFRELAGAIDTVTKAASIQEDAINSLNTALKTSGDFSEEASLDIQRFASSLQQTSTVGDEVILNQVAIAKSFGATNEQAKDLVSAAVELSAATGKSLDSAVAQLGKTFSGLGGELSESLPAIRNLSKEALQAGGAIDLVLSRFGGSALAQTQTFSGSITQLQNTFVDLQEVIGSFITQNPAVVSAINTLNALFNELGKAIDGNEGVGQELLGGFIEGMLNGIPKVINIVADLVDTFGLIVLGISPVVTAVNFLVQKVGTGIALIVQNFFTIASAIQTAVLAPINLAIQGLNKLGAVSDEVAQTFDNTFNAALADTKLNLDATKAGFEDLFTGGVDDTTSQFFTDLTKGSVDASNSIRGLGKTAQDVIDKTFDKKFKVAPEVVVDQKQVKDAAKDISISLQETLQLADIQIELLKIGKSTEEIAKIDLDKKIRDQVLGVQKLIDEQKISATEGQGVINQIVASGAQQRALIEQQESQKRLDSLKQFAINAGVALQTAISGLASSVLGGIGGAASPVEANTGLQDQLKAINEAVLAGELTAAQASEKRFEAERNAQEQLAKISESNLQNTGNAISGVAEGFASLVPGLGGLVGGLLDVLSLPPDALAAQLEGFVDAIPAFISRIAENLPTLISSLAKGLISTLVDAVPKLISQLADIVPELLIGLVDAITSPTFIDSLIAAVAKFITAIINALPRIITSIVKAIPVIIKAIAKELPGIIVAIVRAIPEIINAIILAIPDIILSLVEAIPIIIQGLIEALPELFPELINGAIEALPLIIVAFVKLIPQIIVALAKGIFGIFQSLGSIITNVFSQAGGNLVSGISDAVKNFGSNITNGATTFINKFLEIPGKFLTSLIDGLKDGISKVFEDLDPTGGGGFAGVFGGGGGLFGQGGGGLGLGGGTGLGFAKGIGEVPPGFPNDTLSARLSSGERVVPSDTNNQLQNFLNREEQGGGRTEQLLVEIASLLDQPMSVKTTAEVNGQAFADIFLEMRRNNARLLA